MIRVFTVCSSNPAYTVCMYRPPFPAWILALLVPLALSGCSAETPGPAKTTDAAIERGPGKVLPLSQVLAIARSIAAGKVIDVELESDVGLDDGSREPRWVYEIEVLTADNRVVELEIDATTGELLEIDGAPWPAGIPQAPQ
jgi:hypothetical protein